MNCRTYLRWPILVLAWFLMVACMSSQAENRTLDGRSNNLANVEWGSGNEPFLRRIPAQYADGIRVPKEVGRPNSRQVSNTLCAQVTHVPNTRNLSDFVWLWGQFVDHDMTLAELANPLESYVIAVPAGDPWFDPSNTGTQVMAFARAAYTEPPDAPREQINFTTSYLDASMVYGPNPNRALALREKVGGRMLLGTDNLLPRNTNGLPNANGGPHADTNLFLAGDVRANEHVGLTALHTLFVREHNRICDSLAATENWTDEQLYQRARKIVGAIIQAITYEEFLPALLGPYIPRPSEGYDTNRNATVANEFATALYRIGHTMVSSHLMKVRTDNMHDPSGPQDLRESFFDPHLLPSLESVEMYIKGFAARRQQSIDPMLIDDVRNFMFGPPGSGGLDLAALNIQRGRDHGLPTYNAVRIGYGLTPALSFADITSDSALQQALASVYSTPDDVDLWMGAIAEDHLPEAAVGELVAAGMAEQFSALRDGDRFWYEWDPELDHEDRLMIRNSTLCEVIRRNTEIDMLQADVFHVISETELVIARTDIPARGMRLSMSTERGATYRIQYCTISMDGDDRDWQDIAPFMEGTGGSMSMIDADYNVQDRMYRVMQFP